MSSELAAPVLAVLYCHPSSDYAAVDAIDVAVHRRSGGELSLTYTVRADLNGIVVPSAKSAMRCNELWRHTCAEAFIALPDHDEYVELNFSPSTEWAAYSFEAYRLGMRLADIAAPRIQCQVTAHMLVMHVTVTLPEALQRSASLQLALTMVIESTAGECAYWALTHGAERPDFHRRDSFILSI